MSEKAAVCPVLNLRYSVLYSSGTNQAGLLQGIKESYSVLGGLPGGDVVGVADGLYDLSNIRLTIDEVPDHRTQLIHGVYRVDIPAMISDRHDEGLTGNLAAYTGIFPGKALG